MINSTLRGIVRKCVPLLLALVFCAFATMAQTTRTVTGKVTEAETGAPIPGATVLERGTTNGTATDENGSYSLYVQEDATLVFSSVGYTKEEIAVSGRGVINVSLLPDIKALSEVVVGSRRNVTRSVTETPVAIDIIPVQEVTTTAGQLDLNQLLQLVAPSFNANRQSGSDGSDHIDPATLRGLGPDQTLVLINGKRRHQSSLINIFGTRGRGNTGTDLNTIPAAAIERIEILREGASAQYGSDAIAGVINIVLKSSVNEFTGNVNTGVTKEGDGENVQVSGNYGFQVGEKGFVNMTMDYLHRGRTNRPADPAQYDIYRRQYGDAQSDNFSALFNSSLPVSEKSSFYLFGGFNFRDTDAYAWTREPDSDRNVPSIYPNGFDPRIQSRITDHALTGGFRSKLSDWDVDISNTFGSNRFHYTVAGTLNASLLDQSPTRFDAGGFELMQNTTGINFSRFYKNLFAGSNIAFGTEYRLENYQIFAGEEASWRNYGIIDTVIDNRVQQYDVLGRPGGSQGFPGFRPENVLNEYRTNIGAYVDTEFDITKALMITAAGRFERYSDFGNTLNGKISSRLKLMEGLALRGSISTGFRAPSLAQIYFNTTFTDFVGGVPVDKVIANNNSNITRLLGIPQLKQETAVNGSLGITSSFGDFTATIDGYYVNIKDRIVLTGAFEDSDPDIGEQLQKLNVGAAQFFTNAVDTRTLGTDVILTYATNLTPSQRLALSVAGNFNKMEITNIKTSQKLAGKEETYFGEREQMFLLASAPPSKINFTADYKVNNWNLNLKLIRFGKIVLIDWVDSRDVYEARTTTDLALSRKVGENLIFTVGGANIFNVYPTRQDTETESGGLWDPVQMGIGGRFVYARVRFVIK